ncbi:hypothetical protein GCM10022245_25460 [Streptomyces mayteni]
MARGIRCDAAEPVPLVTPRQRHRLARTAALPVTPARPTADCPVCDPADGGYPDVVRAAKPAR